MDRTELVLAWQRPVFNLAYRLLGNRADAEDATQEVFLRVFDQLPGYDRSRPFKPWLYRVATNVVLNQIRGEKARRRHENEAPGSGPGEEENPVERAEQEALVQRHLQQLPEDSRSLLVLHYYSGLSKSEVAATLDVPRTTVQSRLSHALDRLKASLQRAGHLSVTPVVEELMRRSAPLPVPSGLESSLLGIAATAGTATLPVAAGAAAGGLLVSKKILAGVAAVTVFSLTAGYLAGRAGRDAASSTERATIAGRTESARADDERRRLEAEVERLRAENARLAGGSAPAPTETVDAEAKPKAAAAPAASGIDWSRFAKVFSTNVDVLVRARANDGEASPEDRTKLLELLTEYMDVAQKARILSEAPFFDARVLPGFVDALYSESLGLDAAARDALRESCREVLAREAAGFDAAEALPAELFEVRRRVVRDLLASIDPPTDAGKRERFDNVQAVARDMLSGDHKISHIGIAPDGDRTEPVDAVLREWKGTYGLDEQQLAHLRTIAASYVGNAETLLRRRGLFSPDAKPSEQERLEAEQEMLRLQIETERSFQELLTPKQREDSRGRVASALYFQFGAGNSVHTTSGAGF